MNYESRLNIPIIGNNSTVFSTKSFLPIAIGYTRIVIGGRGPYIEFVKDHLIAENLHMPEDQKYRATDPWKQKVFYLEYRTNDVSNVKIYYQLKLVNYADYKLSMFYISPFDLIAFGRPVIT